MSAAAERILRAVGRHLNWHQGTLVPEAVVEYVKDTITGGPWPDYAVHGTYLADLMWVTQSGYATEIEIKVSRSDWRADKQKGKWGRMPPWVSRFIYAVPADLGIPDFVPPEYGVWHFDPNARLWHQEIRVARAPRRIGKDKVPPEVLARWRAHLYARFWYQRLHGERQPPEAAQQVAA